MYGAIEDLGHAGFELQDRQLVAIAGRAIISRERMRQAAGPLAEERLDVFCAESVADVLQYLGVFAGRKPLSSSS
jgi:hypothetical protein